MCAFKGWYNGHVETCLVHGGHMKRKGHKMAKCKYPVTKNGKLNPGRIRNARARAAQNGDTAAIMKGGWRKFAKRAGIKSSK